MAMRRALLAAACLACAAGPVYGQDMEPRAYSASPVGANFLVVAASRSSGSVVFDPALPITDVHADVNGFVLGLGHTFNLFGKLGLASAAVPYVLAHATGKVSENEAEIHRSGLADSRFKLSVNLRGNDASVVVTAPASQYSSAKLVNLGTNRWSVKPEVGVAVPKGHWDLDAYAGVWIYTENRDFYPGGQRRSQDPVFTLQGHASYTIRPRLWVAGDWTWYRGGSSRVEDGTPSSTLNNSRGGVTLSLPLRARQSLKVAYGSGIVARTGTNFRTLSVAWQALWLSPRWSGR
jgi:hypothetical protein